MKRTCRFLMLFLFSLCLIFLGKPAYAAEEKEYDDTTEDEWYILTSSDDEYGDNYEYIDITFSLNYPTYTGEARQPSILVQTSDGTKLKKGTDYTVSYKNNKKAGVNTATAIVTGIGDYASVSSYEYEDNKTEISFSIHPSKVKGLKKANSTAPLSNKLTWKKVKGADGYVVYRSTKKTKGFEVVDVLTGSSYTTYQDTDLALKSGKTYYYQVYAYVASATDRSDDREDNYWAYKIQSKKSSTIKIKASGKTKEKYYPIYSGDADLDYAAEQICKKIIKKNMSADEKVKAIYKWICKNFEHIKNMEDETVASQYKVVYNFDKKSTQKKAAAYEEKIMKQVYKGKAYLATLAGTYLNNRAKIALTYHKGSCSYINRVFRLLCNHVGVSCGIAGGNPGYTNSSGEKQEHYFCYARTNGKYYWYDADIGTTVSRKRGSVTYAYYKQKSKVWKKNYTWKGDGYYVVPSNMQ